jgi:hypothetical protein
MPCINYFRIIGEVIAASIDSIAQSRHISYESAHKEVLKYLVSNSAQWNSGRQPIIKYEDPLCRIAYLYGIVSVNANLIEYILRKDQELSEFIDQTHADKGQINICAFGGGPGTELLGMAKWLEKRELGHPVVLDFLILDQIKEWLESWQSIQRKMEFRFKNYYGIDRNNWPINVSKGFCPFDITSTENFGNLGDVFGQDLYILSYVVSEIFDFAPDLRRTVAKMVEKAPPGSKFLFVERREQRWVKEIELLSEDAGISISAMKKTTTNMDTDEEKRDLGQIYFDVQRILGRSYEPRITWKAFWTVGTKD